MKRTDIVTTAIMGLGLLGLAAIGTVAYYFDAWRFRQRVQGFATEFPERMAQLRDDLWREEMGESTMHIVEEEGS